MNYEEKLLVYLVDGYRKSKKDTGENLTHRRTKVKPEKLYSKYHANDGDFERISAINHVVEKLEKKGYVETERENFGTELKSIYLVDRYIEEIEHYLMIHYQYESKDSKIQKVKALIESYQHASKICQMECEELNEMFIKRQIPNNLDELDNILKAVAFIDKVYFHEWVEYKNMLSNDIQLEKKDYYHGTAVTSIIVDGPKGNPKLDDGCGRFRVRHFGVATQSGFSSFAILRSIREIVANNPDIKVWNLSLGSPEPIKDNFISPEAAELDRIQSEYDVIFIVAGTNTPDGLVHPEMKVGSPADSLNAMVVNSVTMENESASIEVQTGNFSSWWENKEKADSNARVENEKHLKEIGKLEVAAERAGRWAEKSENTKIGFDPIKEHDRSIDTRGYIGAKTKKMQKRVKAYEGRIDREIEKKEGLLNDIEEVTDLKLMPLKYHKERLLFGRDYSFKYKDSDNNVFDGLSFEINNGDRVVIDGENGSGKSSLIKAILDMNRGIVKENANYEGEGILEVPENLVISYINQDTSHLKGFLKDYCELQGLDYTLFLSLLRQLDFERVQFVKPMEQYSEGQKKKVLIAASLLTSAHLYIWDEPLNYIDVFTRMQIEKLIETYRPTMLLVEHDVTFKEKIANKVIRL